MPSRASTLLCILSTAHGAVHLTCETSKGNVEFDLWPDTAPKGVRRLVDMVESGFLYAACP